MGRRNLLTTASNGSAKGLQAISDRLADNFSILPGHHGTGANGGDGEDAGCGVRGDGNDEAERGDGDGGITVQSFAMFESCRRREGRVVTQPVRACGRREGEREPTVVHSLSVGRLVG